MRTLKGIWAFLRVRKKFWLLPFIISSILTWLLLLYYVRQGTESPNVYL